MNNVKSPFVTQDLDVYGGLYTESNPPDLPPGASPLVINCDFQIGTVGIRPGLESVYYYTDFFSEKSPGFAESIAGSHAPNETPWSSPTNVTLGIIGQYTSVLLNPSIINPGAVLDQGVGNAGASTPITIGPVTPSTPNEYAILLEVANNGSDPLFPGGSWSSHYDDHVFAYSFQQLSSTSPISVSVPLTPGSDPWAATLTLFGASSGTPTIVQEKFFSSTFNGGGTNLTATYNVSTTPGSTLLFIYQSRQNNLTRTPAIVSDSLGNTWQTAVLESNGAPGVATVIGVFYAQNNIGGADTITFNLPSASTSLVLLQEISGFTSLVNNNISQILHVLNFPFSIPSTVKILGFELELSGHQTNSAADAILTVALSHPSATSPTFTAQLPNVDGTKIVGSPTTDWGLSLVPSTFNNPNFGFNIVASALSGSSVTFDLYSAKAKVFVTPDPAPSINYLKTFAQTSGEVLNLFLGSDGIMFQENVGTAEGALTGVYTAIEPNSFAQSATQSDREFIAISNLLNGTDIPYTYDGTNFDRCSQVGPGAAPACSTSSAANTILTITQPTAKSDPESPNHVSGVLWSAGAGNTQQGNVLTVYYARTSAQAVDPDLVVGGTVELAHFDPINGQTVNGDYIITSTGQQTPPHAQFARWFFTVTMPSTQFFQSSSGEPSNVNGTYQVTLATMTTASQVPNLEVGSQFSIAGTGGSPPAGYDGTWTVSATPNASQLSITSVSRSANIATYSFSLISGTNPTVGQFVTVTQTLTANGAFNVSNVQISSVSPGSFSISLPGADQSSSAETGSGIIFGTIFKFEPGKVVGNKSGGNIQTTGTIAAGTRKCCYSFLTRNGYITQPSPITTFTVPSGAANLVVTGLATGPSNVIARIIHFTAAEGGNFYNIPQPVSVIDNGVTVINSSTWVLDNTSNSVTLSFSDGVLLAASQIDKQGNNLFETAEIGSPVGFIPYAQRMFIIGEQDKVTNFLNWSFDGGIGGGTGSTSTYPLGWTVDSVDGSGGSVINSPLFGFAYAITNSTGSTQSIYGMITQTAYQDEFKVPIIQASTTYSARVTAAIPTGPTTGNIVVDLFSASIGQALGTFTIPLSSLATTMNIFTGTMLTTELAPVPNDLVLRLYATSIPTATEVTVDRVEIFPTQLPNLDTQVTGSYIGNYEAFDQVTGVVSGSVQNQQPIRSAFVLFDVLYLVKTKSFVAIRNVDGLEPVFWGTPRVVSNSVGTPSIYGVTSGIDTPNSGEEWAIIVGEAGAFIFNGGEPTKLTEEIQQLWNQINWRCGHTLWVQNDIVNRRILIGVPLKTPNTWLPTGFTADNSNPTTPNVVLDLNYKQLNTAGALANSVAVHPTYSGKLITTDYSRKWSVWPISVPAAAFITRSDTTGPIMFGNSAGTGKVYELVADLLEDDGVAIHQKYQTYGFPSTEQEQALGIGSVRKTFEFMTTILDGTGSIAITAIPDKTTSAFAVPLLPNITLPANTDGDIEVPLNITGNRLFFDFDSNAIGSAFELSRMQVAMRQDPWAPLRGQN